MNIILKYLICPTIVGLTLTSINTNGLDDNELKISNYENLEYQLESECFNTDNLNLKLAKDLIGKEYVIGENKNIGYFIYSPEVSSLIEFSNTSKSPFYGYDKNIYYCGPGKYLIKNNTGYISLLDGISYNDENISKNSAIINKKIEKYNSISRETFGYKWTVGNPEFFSDECKYNCGYISGGRCGFIGLGLLIGYADKYKNDNLMDDKYYVNANDKTGLTSYDNSISQYLYNSKPKDSTTSTHIKNVMNDYAKSRGIKISYTSRWTPFYTMNTITNALSNNIPVELFGNFTYNKNGESTSTGNHAIVAYSVGVINTNLTSTSYKLRCHLGYSGYSDVEITEYTIGSLYFFDC